MSPATYAYSTVLVEMECGNCGVPFAMSETLYNAFHKDHSRNWFCPNGHQRHFIGETEADKQLRLRKYAEDRAASERARADQAEASLRTTKGHVTRLRKRVAAGECPFCGQHLRDLQRHVNRQHAEEAAAAIAEPEQA